MEYIVAMKSGAIFKVQIKDYNKFIQSLQDTVAKGNGARNNYFSEGGFMFCIEDISAIYPASAQQQRVPDAGKS